MTKENSWKILNKECTLAQGLEYLGVEKEQIKNYIDGLDKKDSSGYFLTANLLSISAYRHLLSINEISDSAIFNLDTGKLNDSTPREGSMGLKGDERWYFRNKKWQKIS